MTLMTEDGTITKQVMLIRQKLYPIFTELYKDRTVIDALILDKIISDLSDGHLTHLINQTQMFNAKIKRWRADCAGLPPKGRIKMMLSRGYMSRVELTKLYRWVFEVTLAEANRVIVNLINKDFLLKDKEGLLYWRRE